MEFLSIRSHVEIQVATEELVCAFATEDHLDAQGLDLPRHQVHGRRSPDRGDVVRFDVLDDIFKGVQAFLDGEHQRVVDRADVVGYLLRRSDIWAAFEADAKAMYLGPPRI